MNKVVFIFKSGEKIPYLIFSCEEYSSREDGFIFKKDGETHTLITEWSYFNEFEVGDNSTEVVNAFKLFKTTMDKL